MKDKYNYHSILPKDIEPDSKEDFASTIANSIIQLVIPVIEKRCLQISEEIYNTLKEEKTK